MPMYMELFLILKKDHNSMRKLNKAPQKLPPLNSGNKKLWKRGGYY